MLSFYLREHLSYLKHRSKPVLPVYFPFKGPKAVPKECNNTKTNTNTYTATNNNHKTPIILLYNINFTFVLPCIVIDFSLNNQPDTLIIQIYCYKTLHVSGIFSAHHQEFSTLHSALASFMQVFDDRFQAKSGCAILTSLGNFA